MKTFKDRHLPDIHNEGINEKEKCKDSTKEKKKINTTTDLERIWTLVFCTACFFLFFLFFYTKWSLIVTLFFFFNPNLGICGGVFSNLFANWEWLFMVWLSLLAMEPVALTGLWIWYWVQCDFKGKLVWGVSLRMSQSQRLWFNHRHFTTCTTCTSFFLLNNHLSWEVELLHGNIKLKCTKPFLMYLICQKLAQLVILSINYFSIELPVTIATWCIRILQNKMTFGRMEANQVNRSEILYIN